MSRPLPGILGPDAARVGLSVDENVRRLVRLHWTEVRLMELLLARLPSTPEWEVKCAFALHQWQHASHATLLRERVSEMRSPTPALDAAPDPRLQLTLDELATALDTVELLAGVYGVVRPALADAYRAHVRRTNPLVDEPTHRRIAIILQDEEEALAWGAAALEALCDGDLAARARADAFAAHVRAYLDEAGGIAGATERDAIAVARGGPPDIEDVHAPSDRLHPKPAPAIESAPRTLPERRAPVDADTTPRRDARFRGQHDFDFPPHLLYADPRVPADERNLALLCKRALEMDVPELMASILGERRDLPWELRAALSRQLWDEARHAMMGTVGLAAHGVDFTTLPLNVGFALRLNRHATARERQIMLWAIEQSLMPADTGKRAEYETAVAAGDALSAHFHDYDWADEVLHARIGRRVLRHDGISTEQAMAEAPSIHARTWAALDAYRGTIECPDWWTRLVRATLGREPALRPEDWGPLEVVPE